MRKKGIYFILLVISLIVTFFSGVGVFVGLFIDGFNQAANQTMFDEPIFFLSAMLFFGSIAIDIILAVLLMYRKKRQINK